MRRPQRPSLSGAASSTLLPVRLKVVSALCVLAGLVLLVPAVYYSYLNIDPPEPRPGDLYFGDGIGFIIAAFAGIPAVAALAAGILLPTFARRRRR